MQTGTQTLSHRGSFVGGLLRRQLQIAGSLAIFAALAFAAAALATWNVTDPSLSNANGAVPQNALGYVGASFADILMQFFGLGGAVALIPALFWGLALLRGRSVDAKAKRLLSWIGSAVVLAAFFSLIPAPATWPLPNGLGGVFGDMALKLPAAFTGRFPDGLLAILLGAVLIAPAVWLSMFACGLIRAKTASAGASEDDDPYDDADSEGSALLGALQHHWYTLRLRLGRKTGTQSRRRLDPVDAPLDLHDSDDEPFVVVPINQRASANSAERRTAPVIDDPFEDDDPPFDLDDEPLPSGLLSADTPAVSHAPTARPVPAAPAAPSMRVSAPAERPKPGARVYRDAQGSMLRDDAFQLPAIQLLAEPKNVVKDASLSPQALEQNARMLEGVLEDFGVRGEIIHVRPGPVVTLYELEPAPGIKSSRVIGLADDIARSMSAIAARVAVVPGRNAIGIELPNPSRETVFLRELIASRDYEASKAKLGLALGKTIGGEPVIADLAKMPHVLVAGTTGSGKSVAINTMILSILYKMDPTECRLIMIDPKMLELSVYDGIPHLLTPVVTDPKKAVVALKWTVREMEERYKKMSKIGVRNIDGFNQRVEQAAAKGEKISRTVQTGFDRETGEAVYETEEFDLEKMPYIVVIIDEMADLMMVAGKDIEGAVQRLAQMARAAGIHVIMATQRPSVDVITGTIKANFPTRISFQVTSKIDSRTILGEQGAEQLLGMGDMLYMAGGGRIQRVHGPFVSDREVEDIVNHLKTQGVPQYLDAITEDDDGDEGGGGGPAGTGNLADSDDPYDQAVAIVLRDGKASTSYIQRRLGIGYNRAASLIERMENEGVISPANHAGKREILVPTEDDIDPR